MKILMINSVCGTGSTGRICTELADTLREEGHSVFIVYGRGRAEGEKPSYTMKAGTKIDKIIHGFEARALDMSGFGSDFATRRIIKRIEEYDPDIIHLHNLHGYYLNVSILFAYIRRSGKRVIWTMHDCWPFTGHCCYFDYVGCEKWKSRCFHCPQKREYPANYGPDFSSFNYERKKKVFTGIRNMTIVTPSSWLAELINESFLSVYQVKVIPNWVDTNTFYPRAGKLRKQKELKNKKIILGVASVWDRRKGLDVFLTLKHYIKNNYQIVLIGLNDKQIRELPEGITGVKRTNSKTELAEWYSEADVFVNPTWEDNYPTTNLEAIACGTPVVTFDSGGSGESAALYGRVVTKGNIQEMAREIENIVEGKIRLNRPDVRKMNANAMDQYVKLIEGRT